MIGDRIKELRKTQSINQEKLSQLLGVSRSTVSMWEINKSEPDTQMLIKISNILNCSLDYLLEKSENKKNPHADNDKEELTADENKLLKNFRELNEEGQYMLISQSEALVASGLYIKNQRSRIHLENEA